MIIIIVTIPIELYDNLTIEEIILIPIMYQIILILILILVQGILIMGVIMQIPIGIFCKIPPTKTRIGFKCPIVVLVKEILPTGGIIQVGKIIQM